LKKLYGEDWQFTWRGEDDGFTLQLAVEYPNKRKPSAGIEVGYATVSRTLEA
jgi:hypothetical protein